MEPIEADSDNDLDEVENSDEDPDEVDDPDEVEYPYQKGLKLNPDELVSSLALLRGTGFTLADGTAKCPVVGPSGDSV